MDWFLLAFVSALFSAFSAVSEKKVLFSLNALDFSFIVSAATLVFTIPFFINADFSLIFSHGMLLLFIKSLLGAIAFLFVMLALKNLEISQALPLLALTPGLVAVAGVIFINDILNLAEWAGIIMMLIGAYLLETNRNDRSLLSPFKTLFSFSKYSYVFFALLLFIISSLIDRFLLRDMSFPPFTFMAFQQLFYAIFFAVAVFTVYGKKTKGILKVERNTFYLIIMIAVFTVIYRYTQIEAVKLVPVAMVLSVKRLSVLFAVIFGGRLFKDQNLPLRIAAVVLILTGTTILMLN